MEIGAILTVVFGLIVVGWMFQAFFPNTYKRLNDTVSKWADDDAKKEDR